VTIDETNGEWTLYLVEVSWFTVNWNLIGSALASGERHPAGRSRRPAAKV
jgi:hypothetical protein